MKKESCSPWLRSVCLPDRGPLGNRNENQKGGQEPPAPRATRAARHISQPGGNHFATRQGRSTTARVTTPPGSQGSVSGTVLRYPLIYPSQRRTPACQGLRQLGTLGFRLGHKGCPTFGQFDQFCAHEREINFSRSLSNSARLAAKRRGLDLTLPSTTRKPALPRGKTGPPGFPSKSGWCSRARRPQTGCQK